MERVRMKSNDAATRAKIRDFFPFLHRRKAGQKHRIGRKPIQPLILNNF